MIGDADDDDAELFESAASYVAAHTPELSQEQLLKLYALYKVSTVGKCDTPAPGVFDFTGKKKWNAWKELGNMPQEWARQQYVEMVREFFDDPEMEKGVQGFGGGVSRPLVPEDDPGSDPDAIPVFEWVKAGDVGKVKGYKGGLEVKDADGLSLLHWAVDRDQFEVVKYLVCTKKVNPNPLDSDGETPLAYAVTCSNVRLVKFLLEHSDRSIKNNDGQNALDLAKESEDLDILKLFESKVSL